LVLILSRDNVEFVLTMKDSIEAVENGFRQLGLGKVTMPQRLSVPVDKHHGLILVMPAYMNNEIDAFATKIVTVYPENPTKNNLPRQRKSVKNL